VRLLLLDNYDSFTWNLSQYLQELGADVRVVLNDRVDVAWVREQAPDAVVVSPGPGRPEEAGISLALIADCAGRVPLLGVCLGHQALAQVHGARIVSAPVLMHGKTSWIEHDGTGLFQGLERPFEATRYHSLVVDPSSVAPELRVNAATADGVIMALEHRRWPLWGVQFHPESVLTRAGKPLLANFLELSRGWRRSAAPAARPERPDSSAAP
jgi:anthranilate synthase component 2